MRDDENSTHRRSGCRAPPLRDSVRYLNSPHCGQHGNDNTRRGRIFGGTTETIHDLAAYCGLKHYYHKPQSITSRPMVLDGSRSRGSSFGSVMTNR